MTGVIKTYDDSKGFGFIVPEGKQPRQDDKFFHITQCGEYEPVVGDAVTFEPGIGRNGKPCADNVRLMQ